MDNPMVSREMAATTFLRAIADNGWICFNDILEFTNYMRPPVFNLMENQVKIAQQQNWPYIVEKGPSGQILKIGLIQLEYYIGSGNQEYVYHLRNAWKNVFGQMPRCYGHRGDSEALLPTQPAFKTKRISQNVVTAQWLERYFRYKEV
jgi:hypothetical protein